MKSKKNILTTGLVIAAVMTAGVSVYAAGDVIEDSTETVMEKVRGMRDRRGGERDGMRQARGQHFSIAVEEGILDAADVENIQTYMAENRPDREAVKEATVGMTREEARAYMEEHYPKPENPHADLVTEGIITQEQADQLEAFKPNPGERGEWDMGGRGSFVQAALEDGVIDQSTADAIDAYLTENAPDLEAIREATESMTREEARAYMEENCRNSDDIIGDLEAAGVIDEDDAEALEDFMEDRPQRAGRGTRGQGLRGRSRGTEADL